MTPTANVESEPKEKEEEGEGEGKGEQKKQLFSLHTTSFNFINSIIGSGIIGMPYTLKLAGFGLGIIVLFFVAIISDYSILLLVKGGDLAKACSYQGVVQEAFGRPGWYTLTFLQFTYPFIAMVSYNVIIGDTITKIILWLNAHSSSFVDNFLGNRQFVIILVTLTVTLPLSLYRNIGKLGKWAFLSIMMIVFIIVAVAVRLTTFAKYIPPTEDAWQFADIGVLQAIGIVAFSFMCHHNTMLVHASMERPTRRRWSLVVHFSVLLSMGLCLLVGLLGYISFTGLTQGDLLENYCLEDVLMNVARLAFAITIMLTFPVECFVTREVVENAVFPNAVQPPPLWRHVTITAIIVALVTAVSMATDCLGIVLTLNGVLFAAPLAFVFPPCCVIRLRHDRFLSLSNLAPALLAVFGMLVMVMGTIVTLVDTVQNDRTCFHGSEPVYCSADYMTNLSFLSGGGKSTLATVVSNVTIITTTTTSIFKHVL
ncbi:hypothetical protein ACOMHN_048620 [Nucella lapillus]